MPLSNKEQRAESKRKREAEENQLIEATRALAESASKKRVLKQVNQQAKWINFQETAALARKPQQKFYLRSAIVSLRNLLIYRL